MITGAALADALADAGDRASMLTRCVATSAELAAPHAHIRVIESAITSPHEKAH